MKLRILLIDDQPAHRTPVEDGLRHDGYEVLTAGDGITGLTCAQEELPDVIVLDVLLPRMNGLEVARQLRRSPTTRDIPIIMVTADGATRLEDGLDAGGTVFLQKPFKYDTLLAYIKRQFQTRPPYRQPPNELVVTIRTRLGAPPTAHVSGAGNAFVEGDLPVHLNVDSVGADGRSILADRSDWRRRAKALGYQMYREMFQRAVVDKVRYFMKPGEDHHVRLRLQTDRSDVAVPFEMLFDGEFNGSGDFLVLRHPLSRYITGLSGSRQPICRAFLNSLAASEEKLRVLLIASNTPPLNPGVDAEIDMLAKAIPALFRERRVNVADPVIIPSAEATRSRVLEALHDCRSHIVHYAGHGESRPDSPEKSALYLWRDKDRGGGVQPLTGTAMAAAMRKSDTRLVYLSCCFGGDTAPPAALLNADFLGLAEALVQVGVPSVLSFRSAVNDRSAQLLAAKFYEALANAGETDRALLDARQALSADRTDSAWLSPLLILQEG